MENRIQVESSGLPGRGSTFFFTIPTSAVASRQLPAPTSALSGCSRCHEASRVAEDLIQSFGYENWCRRKPGRRSADIRGCGLASPPSSAFCWAGGSGNRPHVVRSDNSRSAVSVPVWSRGGAASSARKLDKSSPRFPPPSRPRAPVRAIRPDPVLGVLLWELLWIPPLPLPRSRIRPPAVDRRQPPASCCSIAAAQSSPTAVTVVFGQVGVNSPTAVGGLLALVLVMFLIVPELAGSLWAVSPCFSGPWGFVRLRFSVAATSAGA